MANNLKSVLQDTKMPKQRNLTTGKKYRENVQKWGEPNLNRKRVIIVPNIASEARDVDVGQLDRDKGLQTDSNVDSDKGIMSGDELKNAKLLAEYDKYKAWVAERKKLRSVINHSGLNQNWLDKKTGKTLLEKRVLKRMKRDTTPDIRVRKVLPEVKSPEEDPSITGVDKGVPQIHQPSPAALAIIQEYLDKKRMRLVDLFAQADKDKNWIVSRDEFRKIIKSSGIALSATDLEDLIMALDKDDNDALDYSELSMGRQAYLENRIDRQSPKHQTTTNTKVQESPLEETKEEGSPTDSKEGSDSRPSSPAHRSSQSSPTLKEIPDRPGSAVSLARRASSPSLLEVPVTALSEKVEKVSLDEMKNMRMKKQQKRKEREKAKKKKQVDKPQVAPSTLGGRTGEVIDRYRKRTMQEYNDTVKLCDMNGVQLSKALLGRVLLQPEDKPISQCLPKLRQRSYFNISTRHYVPTGLQLKNPEWAL